MFLFTIWHLNSSPSFLCPTHAQTFFRGVGNPTVRIYFYSLRVRSASLAELRMRICYQNKAGSSISKRENIKLWRDFSPNCASVSLGEQRILIK
jgi:hypothetical protein